AHGRLRFGMPQHDGIVEVDVNVAAVSMSGTKNNLVSRGVHQDRREPLHRLPDMVSIGDGFGEPFLQSLTQARHGDYADRSVDVEGSQIMLYVQECIPVGLSIVQEIFVVDVGK